MSHNLDINAGVASFVSANTDAWHSLGQVVHKADGSGLTALEAMREGQLADWHTRKLPLFYTTESGDQVGVPGRYATVRDNPVIRGQVDTLGVVGEDYTVVQNEAHAELLDYIADESGAHFETAGALCGGRQTFLTMKLPSTMLVGGVDPVDTYVASINSHDGSMAFTLMVTPVRIVCANTLNMAFGNHKSMLRRTHTTNIMRDVRHQARAALDLTFKYLDEFQAQAEQMINTTLTQSRFEQLIAAEFGAPEGAAAATVTRTNNKLEEMASLFSDAFTQEGVRNTVWAGLNALTEWNDHLAPTRGTDRDVTRSVNAILDPSFKQRALQLMMAQYSSGSRRAIGAS